MNYIDKLPENVVQIKGALNWVDMDGIVYGKDTKLVPNRFHDKKYKTKNFGKYFICNSFINNYNGYKYVSIKYIINEEKGIYQNRQKRLHILVAQAFIENPNNYPIVGHKNNIKSDCRVDNLYWTTPKENTQKAVDDGLLCNDKGYEDSQSMPVYMFDTYTNKLIQSYGSICEASKKTGIGKNTIARQCKYKKPVRRPFYFRFQNDETAVIPPIIIQYDFNTDKEIGRYWNAFEASRQTGINSKTIACQCKLNRKPISSKSNTYFMYGNN